MKISTRGRYGTRAMLELALHYGREGPVLLREIARRQQISERYLERIMATLVSAGLVRSLRGQHGGFNLARPPGKIKLSEIIQVVEGSLAPVACVETPQVCSRVEICVTREVWTKLKKAMMEVLENITLQDLARRQKEKLAQEKSPMYYI
jgi:Rrf2 family protein